MSVAPSPPQPLALRDGATLTGVPVGPAFRIDEQHPRVLTPAARRRSPAPRWTAIAWAASLLVAIVTSWIDITVFEVMQALAAVVALVTSIRLAAWAEDRLFTWMVGQHGALRVAVAVAAPMIGLAVLVPLAAAVGGQLERIGGGGAVVASLVLASLWFSSAAVGSLVVAVIDIGVSAVVRGFRARVQLAVLGLLLMTSGIAVVVYGGARFFATRIADLDVDSATKWLDARIAQSANPEAVNLTFHDRATEKLAALLARPEVADLAALGLFVVVASISFPAVLSAAGKLAEAVMERLHPLSQGFTSIAEGDLTVRLEEAGSNDFVRISKGFNEMTGKLAEAVTALDARNRELVDIHAATQRFVPFPFLQLLGKQSIREITRGDHVALEISVLFSDIRGFTTFAEARGAEETFRFINRYLSFMEPAIHARNGFINDFFGDGIMALYHGDVDAALQSAIEMAKALDAFNRELAAENAPPVRIGIGLHTGALMLGTIGGRNRLDCTVIGDPANLASRVEGMTKLYRAMLLVTEATVARLRNPDDYGLRELDCVRVKGKRESVTVYEVLNAEAPDVAAAKLASLEEFAMALAAYRCGELANAQAKFEACRAACPEDGASALYIERCAQWLGRGVPPDWTGVTDLRSK